MTNSILQLCVHSLDAVGQSVLQTDNKYSQQTTLKVIEIFNILCIFVILAVADSLSIPRFTKHSWIAFSALRGAYKHVQVSKHFVTLGYPENCMIFMCH